MLSYKPQPTYVESLCQIQSDTTGVVMQGEKSRYQLHTWEVLQSDKQGTVVTSANTTRTTGRTTRSPMRSYCSYEVYESTWSEGPKHSYVS